VDGQDGAFFDNPPEMVAFARWQRADSLGVERDFARQWRNALSTMDLTNFYPIVRSLGGGKPKLRNLDEAKKRWPKKYCMETVGAIGRSK
jgi:hypothetical protein